MFAVSSACLNDRATNEIAPRLYTSSGWDVLQRRHQRRQVGEIAGHQLDERQLGLRPCSPLGLFWPLTMPNTS